MPADKYANRAFFDVTETAANTLTFSQVNTGIQAFSRMAWIIHRVDWYWGAKDDLGANADQMEGALCSSNKFTEISLEDPSIFDYVLWGYKIQGTPAAAMLWHEPIVHDYSSQPGGGIIVPGFPLFIAAQGTSLANPQHITARVWYTLLELKADEYIELVETLRMIE